MDYQDQMRAPRAYVQGPAAIRIVEKGPARVALEVTRQTEGSKFVQTIRLSAGDAGNRVEFANAIDWMTKEAHLKADFPLAASNKVATYNWDVGTIERATNDERQFEVASHQWFDLTDQSGAFGVTVLSDSKTGSDKPDDSTLRLTLVRTPGTRGGYEDQGTQDLGHHDIVYGLASHAGNWREAQTDWQGQRLNQPLLAFEAPKHGGALGSEFSLLRLNNSRVRVLAVKRAEQSEEIIVRLVELDGRKADNVRIGFAAPILAAREVNGVESPVGPATVTGGELVTGFTPYQPRTFAVKLGPPPAKLAAPESRPVTLPYNQPVASADGSISGGRFDSAGRSLPSEMLPREITYGGVRFSLAPASAFNAVIPRGQTISLPAGDSTRLYVLAAADGDQRAVVPDRRLADRIDDPGLGRVHRAVGQPDLEGARRGRAAAPGAACAAGRHAAADADRDGVLRPHAGIRQESARRVVRVAPSRVGRNQRSVRLFVPVRLCHRHTCRCQVNHAPGQRADPNPSDVGGQ